MTLMHFDPFRDLERLTGQALAQSRGPRALPMEALRRGDGFLIAMDVPGVDPADVDVSVERNVVTVRAHREPLREHAAELSADFNGGVLLLRIPVAEASKPRKVEIAGRRGESDTVQAGSAEPANA